MMNRPYVLPIWDTVAAAWNRVYGCKKTFLAAYGTAFLIMIGLAMVEAILEKIFAPLKFPIAFINYVVSILFTLGYMYMGVLRAEDKPFTYKDVFRAFEWRIAIYGVAVYILFTLISIPFIAVMIITTYILPGFLSFLVNLAVGCGLIYLVIRLWLSVFFVVDRVVDPIQALKMSYAATQDNFWSLFGITLLIMLFVVISAIPLGIGLIWTIPFGWICGGLVYKNLSVNVGNV